MVVQALHMTFSSMSRTDKMLTLNWSHSRTDFGRGGKKVHEPPQNELVPYAYGYNHYILLLMLLSKVEWSAPYRVVV